MRFIRSGEPVISVDTKKKELVGEYANKGREWHFEGLPELVNTHDFPDPAVPRAHPYGVYDLARNSGFVNLGTDHDTATFAVASIRCWWLLEGQKVYPSAKGLLLTADGGGSNGSRLRLWKWELQRFADEIGIPISDTMLSPRHSSAGPLSLPRMRRQARTARRRFPPPPAGGGGPCHHRPRPWLPRHKARQTSPEKSLWLLHVSCHVLQPRQPELAANSPRTLRSAQYSTTVRID